jgi:hypothetical protein
LAAAATRSPIPPLQCVEIVGTTTSSSHHHRGVGSNSAGPAAAAAAAAVAPTAALSPPPAPVVTTLLVKLAESCQTHFATRHANEETTTTATTLEQAPCRSDLETLVAVLPRVEASIVAAMTSTKSSSSSSSISSSNTQIFQLCHFYTDAMDGGFCPHATLLFLSAESSTSSLFAVFFFWAFWLGLFGHGRLGLIVLFGIIWYTFLFVVASAFSHSRTHDAQTQQYPSRHNESPLL